MSKNTCQFCNGYHASAQSLSNCALDYATRTVNDTAARGDAAIARYERAYDGVVRRLERQSAQINNQAETIDELRVTVNNYAARINELQDYVQRINEAVEAAGALALRAEQNRKNAVEELGRVRGELLDAQSQVAKLERAAVLAAP